MAGHSHKYWICPFFKWDEPLCVNCEGGKQKFPDKTAIQEYTQRYCASEQWKQCTIAANLLRYYERTEA